MSRYKQIEDEDGNIKYVKIRGKDDIDPLEDNRTDIKTPEYRNGVCQLMPIPNPFGVKSSGFWRTDNPQEKVY